MESKCLRCGYCCWDWRTPEAERQPPCEHLRYDDAGLSRCVHWEHLDDPAVNRAECWNLMTPAQAPSLPDHCGWVRYWIEQGLIPPRE